jgi:hypothetical protein
MPGGAPRELLEAGRVAAYADLLGNSANLGLVQMRRAGEAPPKDRDHLVQRLSRMADRHVVDDPEKDKIGLTFPRDPVSDHGDIPLCLLRPEVTLRPATDIFLDHAISAIHRRVPDYRLDCRP